MLDTVTTSWTRISRSFEGSETGKRPLPPSARLRDRVLPPPRLGTPQARPRAASRLLSPPKITAAERKERFGERRHEERPPGKPAPRPRERPRRRGADGGFGADELRRLPPTASLRLAYCSRPRSCEPARPPAASPARPRGLLCLGGGSGTEGGRAGGREGVRPSARRLGRARFAPLRSPSLRFARLASGSLLLGAGVRRLRRSGRAGRRRHFGPGPRRLAGERELREQDGATRREPGGGGKAGRRPARRRRKERAGS